jgi:CheY-like chemotaxis protein
MAKILLIDDDEQVLKVMTSFLEKEGHEISTAENGIEGIRHMEAQQFDLVITDVIMPEQDGIGVMLWLTTQSHRPKIIAMTGGSKSLDQDFILHMCRRMHADKVLPKPVDCATLTNSVDEVLNTK